ncbi:hypothetical protein YC2023_084048 [Brassica napus]
MARNNFFEMIFYVVHCKHILRLNSNGHRLSIILGIIIDEDGRMERQTLLETWRSLPDSNEDFPGITITRVESTLDCLPRQTCSSYQSLRTEANTCSIYQPNSQEA